MIGTEGLSHLKYRADIDGLRALAVLSVVIFHAFPVAMPGGFIGVDIFFVISGYLISTIIFENLKRGTFSFLDFYARRVKRIFPALVLVLFGCYALGALTLFPDEYHQLGKHIAAGAAFASNFLLWHESGYFDNAAELKPLLHLWSLGIEEQFYIVWPLILWFCWVRSYNILKTLVLIASLSFIFNLLALAFDPVAAFYSPLSRFWELMVGSLLAWLTLNRPAFHLSEKATLANYLLRSKHVQAIGRERLCDVLSLAGLIFISLGMLLINKGSEFPGFWALFPVFGAVMLLASGSKAWVNRILLSNRVAVWFGLISFPLYLWHWPLISFARILSDGVPSFLIRLALVVLSIFFAWLTYRFVEIPIRFRVARKEKDLRVLFLVMSLLVIGALGFSVRYFVLVEDRNLAQLSYEFPQTVGCKAKHPYATEACYESPQQYADTIALVGDSHMEALVHGFKDLHDRGLLKFNVFAISKGGCNPFVNSESFTADKRPWGCKNVITGAIKEILERPDIMWVVLAGRHAARFNGTPFGEAELAFSDLPSAYTYNDQRITSSEGSAAFIDGLNETVDLLSKAGKRVVFVHQVPELGFDPRRCLPRFGDINVVNCDISARVVMSRLQPYKMAVEKTLRQYPEVIEYDPLGLLCEESGCSPFRDGALMYRDDDHPSMYAAEVIASEIVQQAIRGRFE
jgi:peptidoglycan/LPS O-acetylase OafA/YrhL